MQEPFMIPELISDLDGNVKHMQDYSSRHLNKPNPLKLHQQNHSWMSDEMLNWWFLML